MRNRWKKAKRRHRKRSRTHRNSASPPTNSLYEPLPSQSSIRLITLHPGNFNDPIRCILEVFELASVPPYEAISYVWGDPTLRNRIRCNGMRHLIGDNLYDALRNVRLEDEPRVVWVDALCIDQTNLGERSHQVLLMRNIYSHARRTLICLDIKPCIDHDEDRWTSIAYQALLKIVKWSERNSLPSWFTGVKFETSEMLSLESRHRVALNRLFSCKWFCRVWIIQETVLSPESVFIVDGEEWRWYPLGVASCRLFENFTMIYENNIDMSTIESLAQATQIWSLIVEREDGAIGTLFTSMITFRYALATDPRDMIYGLLAISKEQPLLEQQMSSGSNGPIPLPNYEDTLIQVFADWTRYFIESSRSLDILCRTLVWGKGSPDRHDFVPHGINLEPSEASWTVEDAGFPSWVPRWHRLLWSSLYSGNVNNHHEPLGRSSSNLPLKLKSSPRRDTIVPSGVMFDSVRWTGHVMYLDDLNLETQVDTMLNNFISIDAEMTSYPGGGTVQNVFAIVAAAGYLQPKLEEETFTPGEDMMAYFALLTTAPNQTPDSTESLNNNTKRTGWSAAHLGHVRSQCLYRRFFITEKGYIGLGPGPMEVGDLVCVLFGGKTPFILRKVEDHFRLIGESYIHGIMDGEVIQQLEAGELEEQWFEIR